MSFKISKPTHPYDPAWRVWNAQNPGVYKSVGAAADGDNADGQSGEGGAAGDAGAGNGGSGDASKGGKNQGSDNSQNNGGQNKPSDREAQLLREVMEKKGKVSELSSQLTTLQTQLKEWEGLDPKQIKDLLKAQKDKEEADLLAKGEFQKVKDQMNTQHQAELKAKQDEVAALQQQISALGGQISDLTVGRAFGDSKFVNEELVLTPSKARILYGSHFEIDAGKVVAYDKPKGEQGRAPLVDGKGNPLGFDDALKMLVDADPDRDRMIKSKIVPGAGSKTEQGGKPPAQTADLKGQSRIAAVLAKAKAAK